MKKQQITIIKIGGKVLENKSDLSKALELFARINGLKILVHGGGTKLDGLLHRLGIRPQMVNGRRITDAQTLDAALMVYAGLENKKIVAALQALRCPAIGLSGADAGILLAEKRPVGEIDYGLVGDVKQVNRENLMKIIQAGFVPVLCALTHDGSGQMLNTNADTIASEMAAALSALYHTRLIFAFEKIGVLKDVNNERSLIKELDRQSYLRLKAENIINNGMMPKLDNAFMALNAGADEVFITRFDKIDSVGEGTRIVL
ncbi:MAG TPA: acetylglutamate kinase [Caldithrix abyssi]|uniref:Acetylglutamate kinase n=1 Tax=Caldithrix abyssi TaxID=187145 RepID=A0A7V4WTS3_CALAY|nr:acetylglutamate kinase [Caldithrix abyssi]